MCKKRVDFMEKQSERTYSLQSVDKALQILCLFSEREQEFSLTEISRRMGMSNPVALKYLNTLEKRGFLVRDKQTKRYALGLAIVALSGVVRKNNAISKAARPIMKDLAANVGESIYLQVPVLSIYEAVTIGIVETQKSVTSRFLSSCKLYAGASRKVLLAYLGEDYLQHFLESVKMEPYTENTHIEPEVLKGELESIREQGYAISYGETIQGACGIAAPVFDADGITASLMIYIPSYRVTEEILERHLKNLLEASQKISKILGG